MENKLVINNANKDCNVFNAPVYGGIFLPPAVTKPEEPTDSQSDHTPPVSALTERQVAEERLKEGVRRALEALMEERYTVTKERRERQEPLISKKCHWQAVYRIFEDKGYCGKSDFKGFMKFITPLMPAYPTAECSYESIRTISQTCYNRPFNRWKREEADGKRKYYERMVAIAERTLALLEAEGI